MDIAVAATMPFFVCAKKRDRAFWYKQSPFTYIVLNSSPQENAHLTIFQGAPGREKRSNE